MGSVSGRVESTMSLSLDGDIARHREGQYHGHVVSRQRMKYPQRVKQSLYVSKRLKKKKKQRYMEKRTCSLDSLKSPMAMLYRLPSICSREHPPCHNQNPNLEAHPNHPETEHDIPILACRSLQQPHQCIHVQPAGRPSLALLDYRPEKLYSRSNHAGQVKHKQNKRLQDDGAGVQASGERQQQYSPDKCFSGGANCNTVRHNPVRETC